MHRTTLYRALGGLETTQAEARRLGAFVEDALTEADALAAAVVGDWRIIASIEDSALRILVIRIGNRKEVYRR